MQLVEKGIDHSGRQSVPARRTFHAGEERDRMVNAVIVALELYCGNNCTYKTGFILCCLTERLR